MKTVRELLQLTIEFLLKKNIATPRLDAELLLSHALSMNRVSLYCSFDRPVSETETSVFRDMIRRRLAYEPVAYILGKKEFYGIEFRVNPSVLIPRPDTETLVEAALNWLKANKGAKVFDIGTGSGAIAITLAIKNPFCSITAGDIAPGAIETAQENAKTHGVDHRVDFVTGELFAGQDGPYDLIVSNPPYISPDAKDTLAPDILDHEPGIALFAGNEGLGVIENIIEKASIRLNRGGALMMEIGHDQKEKIYNLVKDLGVFRKTHFENDLAGISRIICCEGFSDEILGDSDG